MKATILVFASVLCAHFALADQGQKTTSLGETVLQFCKDNLGKQVGGGECAHLVSAALKAAEARPSLSFADFPAKGDYVWGELIYVREVNDGVPTEKKIMGKRIRPGDVIQFRDAKFMGKKGGGTYNRTSSHHTAVVVELKKNGELAVLHQNSNNKRYVFADAYYLNDLQSGWVRIYTPIPK